MARPTPALWPSDLAAGWSALLWIVRIRIHAGAAVIRPSAGGTAAGACDKIGGTSDRLLRPPGRSRPLERVPLPDEPGAGSARGASGVAGPDVLHGDRARHPGPPGGRTDAAGGPGMCSGHRRGTADRH